MTETDEIQPALTKAGKRALIAPWRWILVQGIIYFAAAGSLSIPRGWIFFAMLVLTTIISNYIGWKVIPGTYNERGTVKEDTKKWDIVLLSIYFITILIFIPLIAGLDVGRYQWSVYKFGVVFPGVGLYCLFTGVIFWSLLENRHFEGTVRIQTDRDHQVISTGPYRFVRHPGYTCMICMALIIPLILGSQLAMIPAAIASVTMVIRTHMEDKTLRHELKGYTEYAGEVKYRLFPGIW